MDKEKKRATKVIINVTSSTVHRVTTWFSHIFQIHSFTSNGTALLYTKVVNQFTSSNNSQETKIKKNKESINIKVLYNVDKTAQNCYKKGRRTV